MIPFLSLDDHHMTRLGPKGAVEVFRSLLWADSTVYGTRIDVPEAIYAKDGGVDATVCVPPSAPPPPRGPSVIQTGLACYQIKSGRSAGIGNRGARRRLLYGRSAKDAKNAVLPLRVERCLEEGGTMVFVLFGSDAPARAGGARPADLLRDELPKKWRASAKIEVLHQNELIFHLERYPALRRRLLDAGHASYRDRTRWGADADMRTPFVEGPGHREFFRLMRERIRSPERWPDVRITGAPGSGKTRAAYEITGDDGLAPLVIYFDSPAPLRDGGMLDLLIESRRAHAILVVDECDDGERERLLNRTASTEGRIRLVTMHNDAGDNDGSAAEVPSLGRDEIKAIIGGYNDGIPPVLLDDLADWCTPSPRYAHRLGERARSNLQDLVEHPLDERRLHRHYIAGGLDLAGADYRRREAALLWFGLFTKVGHDRPYSEESAFLAAKLRDHMGMPVGEFDSIVDDLRALKILQGYKTLYVAPTLLHWWLWREWWGRNGRRFPGMRRFLSADGSGQGRHMPPSLFGRFADMFANSSASAEAAEAAADMLSENGLFGDGRLLDDPDGARLFLALSRAVPDAALRLLARTVGTWDDSRLARFAAGRREAVSALETAARRPGAFPDAARVLLRLAANGNESFSNSASGVFAGLFAMAPGRLAATPVGAGERLAFLEKTLDDPDGRVRILALDACDRALESVHFTRMDHERGRMLGSREWSPGRREAAAYREVLGMLRGRMARMDGPERKKAADIVLKRAVQLSRLGGVAGHAARTMRFMHDNRLAGRERMLEAVVAVTSVDAGRMSKRDAAAWRSLESRMSGSDYRSRMERYVGMDLSFDRQGAGAGRAEESRSDEQIRLLAAETLRNPGALAKEAGWVFGPRAKNALRFGIELGRQDTGHGLLPALLEGAAGAEDCRPDALLGGYLSCVFERDEGLWEDALDAMAANPPLAPSVPPTTWRSGLTDRAWDRMAALYRSGAAERSSLAMFAHANRACLLSDRAFEEAIAVMLGSPSLEELHSALALLAGRCRCDGPRRGIPLGAACSVVADPRILSGGGAGGGVQPASEFDWARPQVLAEQAAPAGGGRPACELDWSAVAMRIVEEDPESIPALAGACLGAMGSCACVFGGRSAEPLRVLDGMASAEPERMWEAAAALLEGPPSRRSRLVLQWAGGLLAWPGSGMDGKRPVLLDTAPLGAIWRWVDKDGAARAPLLAGSVPRAIERGRRCIARDLLVRYGADRNVRNSMLGHFLSGTWIGSREARFSKMKKRYEGIARAEDDPNVSRWLGELIVELEAQAESGRASDERDE